MLKHGPIRGLGLCRSPALLGSARAPCQCHHEVLNRLDSPPGFDFCVSPSVNDPPGNFSKSEATINQFLHDVMAQTWRVKIVPWFWIWHSLTKYVTTQKSIAWMDWKTDTGYIYNKRQKVDNLKQDQGGGRKSIWAVGPVIDVPGNSGRRGWIESAWK